MDLNCWTHFECSIDCDHISTDRPYGGLAWICKQIKSVSYKVIERDSDRVSGLQVIQNGCVKLNSIGVYLSHYNGSAQQIQMYGETLEIQGVLHSHSGEPVIRVGDMNASVPQTLSRYAQTGFAVIHLQKIVYYYDFLVNNSLCIGNFAFKPSVKYTCSKGKHRSYIDHVLVQKYLMPTVKGCVILEVPCNTSDHMPIQTSISLDLDNSRSAVDSTKEYPNTGLICPSIDWSNMEVTKTAPI